MNNPMINLIRDKLIGLKMTAITMDVVSHSSIHGNVQFIAADKALPDPIGVDVKFSHCITTDSHKIPVFYDAEQDLMMYLETPKRLTSAQCLDLFFDVRDISPDDMNEWSHAKNGVLSHLMQTSHENNRHLKGMELPNRWLRMKDAEGNFEPLQFIVFRIWNNNDFHCHEHPETLVLAPLGQYHCPECGQMQVAGMPHLVAEEM